MLCTFIAVLSPFARAQTDVLESDPLRARKLIVYDQVGGFAGVSFNNQNGTIVTDCECSFEGGSGAGLVVGAMFERLTRSRLTFGASLSFETRSMSGRFREIEGVLQRAPSSGREYTVPIEFLHEADVGISMINVLPFAKYVIFDAIFIRVGPQLGYIVSGNLTHNKTLVSDTVRFPNGESASVSLPDNYNSKTAVLQDGPIKNLQNVQLSVAFAGGIEIRPSKQLFISPTLQYVLPFTGISSATGDFSISAFQALLEIRFII